MPSNNCHIQTGSCMLIAVPLTEACAIVTAAPTQTSAGFGEITAEAERQDGTDYSVPNFGGVACGFEAKGDTVEKWENLAGNACVKNWAFMSATSGNPLVVDEDGNVVGYGTRSRNLAGVCDPVTKPRVAIAIIRRAATSEGGCSTVTSETGATPFVLHEFPMTTDWLWGIPPFSDTRAVVPFTAKGYANPAIGAGPLNLWPATYVPNAIPNDNMHAEVFIGSGGIPTVDCNTPISHPAPAVRSDDDE